MEAMKASKQNSEKLAEELQDAREEGEKKERYREQLRRHRCIEADLEA